MTRGAHRRAVTWAGALAMGAAVAAGAMAGAPVCIENHAGQALLLVVDPGSGRLARVVGDGGRLCAAAPDGATRATVGVFADADALEGCSRLTRPGQVERLLAFAEFDNCRWAPTPRDF